MLTRVDIATQIETISNVKTQRLLVNTFIQVALNRVYQFHDWPYYMDYKNGALQTVAPYTTGTVDVTKGSTSVDSNGTNFISSMVGRKIRVKNNKVYYRISSVNLASGVGALTLDVPYQDSNAANQTFSIFKDEYLLKPDVDKYKTLRQTENALMVIDLLPNNFDEMFTMPTSFSEPFYGVDIGNGIDVYSTGSISSTGTTITGAGTGWTSVEGLGKMSKIRERTGNTWYTVKSVDSDTQITTYETFPSNLSAGTLYEVSLNNIVIQLYPIPSAARNLYYRYFRLPKPLANDYDLPDMPYDYHHLLIWGALSEVLSQKGDINKAENTYETRFLNALQQMKLKIGKFAPDRKSSRKNADTTKRGYDKGLEAPTFDRRYSF